MAIKLEMGVPKKHILFLSVIGVLILGCYSNSFHGNFFLDDFRNIHTNQYVKIESLTLENLKNAATLSPCSKRWLPNLSLALNYYLGGLNPFGYKIFNLVVHISTATALYFLFFFTLTSTKQPGGRESLIAFAAAALWAVHPLQTNGVSYIVQRMTSMAALFFVLALVCYIRARSCKGQKRQLWFIGCGTAAICAFVSKENTIILPLMLGAYEFYFIQPEGRRLKGKNIFWIGIAIALLLFGIAWIALGHNPLSNILAGYKYRNFTIQERLLTEPRVLFHYLGLLLWPLPGRLNLAYDFSLSHSLFQPISTFFSIIGIITVSLLVPALYRRHRLLSFAVLWFLINQLIESSVIPLEIIFEHRMYLPGMFLFLPPVLWLDELLEGKKQNPAAGKKAAPGQLILLGSVLLIAAALGAMSWQRNKVWNDDILFWQDVVNKSPRLSRGYVELGIAQQDKGNHPAAISSFERAIAMEPSNGAAWLNLGFAKEQQGDLPGALECYFKASEKPLVPKHKVYSNISRIFLKQGKYQEGLDWARKALEIAPGNSEAWANCGVAYDFLGLTNAAEEALTKATQLSSRESTNYYRLALFLCRQNRFPEALEVISRGISASGIGKEVLLSLKEEINSGLRK